MSSQSSFSQLNAADSEKPRALRVQGGVVIKPQGISARLIIFNYHTKIRVPKIMNCAWSEINCRSWQIKRVQVDQACWMIFAGDSRNMLASTQLQFFVPSGIKGLRPKPQVVTLCRRKSFEDFLIVLVSLKHVSRYTGWSEQSWWYMWQDCKLNNSEKITEWKTSQGVQQIKHSEEFIEFIYFQIGRIAIEFNTMSCPTHLRCWTRIQH